MTAFAYRLSGCSYNRVPSVFRTPRTWRLRF